jgi:hypothetical protein
MQKNDVANESPIMKNRRWLHVDKVTCCELVTKTQLMVDVASHCDIERNINEKNVDEGSEQKHRDIWCGFSFLQFLQTKPLPFNINEKKNVHKKHGTKLFMEEVSLVVPTGDGT